MKKTLIFAFLMVFAVAGFAQVTVIPTTLSAAVTSTSATTVVVAAATGLNSNSYSIAANTSFLYIDGELMAVNSVNGTTLKVTRGYGGSRAGAHKSGALVFVGPANFFSTARPGLAPNGACTRSDMPALPRPDVSSQAIFDCLGGQWVVGQNGTVPNYTFNAPPVGGVLYTGINGSGTTEATNTQYCTEVDLPSNMFVTGLGVLNGTTVGADKHVVALYDGSGNLLYQSAAAGATTATASNFQNFAFTLDGNGNTISKAYLVGPARYFACAQSNGNTDNVRMAVTGQNDGVLTKSVSSITFGTFTALTVPTSFTTAVGPYFRLY